MCESPIAQLLRAIDGLDLHAAIKLLAPDARLLTADGRRGAGAEAVRELLSSFVGTLRSTKHTITAEWHQDDVWIAEVKASYELRDYLQLNDLPRVFIARVGPTGIVELRAYGAHEQPLTEHRTGEEGDWVGTRWIPPL